MVHVSCYDIEEQRIQELCDEYDITEPELIEALIAAVDDGTINLADYV